MSSSRLNLLTYGKLRLILAVASGAIAALLLTRHYLFVVVLVSIALLLTAIAWSRFWPDISFLNALVRVVDAQNTAMRDCAGSFEKTVSSGRKKIAELHSEDVIDSEMLRLLDNQFRAMRTVSVASGGESLADRAGSILDARVALDELYTRAELMAEMHASGVDEIVDEVAQRHQIFRDCQTKVLDGSLRALRSLKPPTRLSSEYETLVKASVALKDAFIGAPVYPYGDAEATIESARVIDDCNQRVRAAYKSLNAKARA